MFFLDFLHFLDLCFSLIFNRKRCLQGCLASGIRLKLKVDVVFYEFSVVCRLYYYNIRVLYYSVTCLLFRFGICLRVEDFEILYIVILVSDSYLQVTQEAFYVNFEVLVCAFDDIDINNLITMNQGMGESTRNHVRCFELQCLQLLYILSHRWHSVVLKDILCCLYDALFDAFHLLKFVCFLLAWSWASIFEKVTALQLFEVFSHRPNRNAAFFVMELSFTWHLWMNIRLYVLPPCIFSLGSCIQSWVSWHILIQLAQLFDGDVDIGVCLW